MTTVALQNLDKRYDDQHHAVVDFSLSAPGGAITALLGPSGCGKTTLLKLIAGLLPPSGGDIRFDGLSILDLPAERRGAVMVFQNHLLFPHLNVADNVGFGLKMRGVAPDRIRRRVAEMLELVRLPGYEARRPQQLSGGQQQRVALARALIIEPRVLLLDEPLSNLDAHLRQEMRDLILRLQRQLGITTVVVTHDQEEAVILADHIALIFNGRLQQAGAPADFYERPFSIRVARFFGGVNFIPGEKKGGQVRTGLGNFVLTGQRELPDGPVQLTIRPEHIRMVATRQENAFPGRIRSHLYAGTHTRFRISPAAAQLPELEVVSAAADRHRFPDGDALFLQFPPEHIWLIAAEE